MSKFAQSLGSQTRSGSSAVKSTSTVVTNHGGALAYERTSKSDLFLLGVMNFVGEDTFYESATDRDNRFVQLVHTVTKEDPTWVENFIPWLRNSANMRSASVVAAVEYVRAGGPNARSVISSACSRADEPAEVLSYWIGKYGKPIKSSVKRGVADAAARLYNERSVLKYDGNSRGMRMGDVLQLTHAKPSDDKQSVLYKAVLEMRYGNKEGVESLPVFAKSAQVRSGAVTRDELLADPSLYRSAGMTWEQLSGLGPMDKAAWELAIPTMGYMATLRNLRNFEQAGISAKFVKMVVERIEDPEQVAKSRQLPFRFWSAYRNTNSLKWASALETALGESLKNLPELGGRTLVLVDTSASMQRSVTDNGSVAPLDAAAIFGSALALKGESVDLHGFANTTDANLNLAKGGSILKGVELLRSRVGRVGHGTNIPDALRTWNGHDRVILISDMQTLGGYSYSYGRVDSARDFGIPERVPVFAFNLQGYGGSQVLGKNQFELGGLTDHTFKTLPLLERAGSSKWPWED